MEAGGESRLRWSRNAQLLHFGLESGPLHPERGRRPRRSTNGPVRLVQRLENMFAFGMLEGCSPGVCDVTRRPL